jgi:hypothetical protein
MKKSIGGMVTTIALKRLLKENPELDYRDAIVNDIAAPPPAVAAEVLAGIR